MALNDLQRACTGSALAIGAPLRGWREWGLGPDGIRGALGKRWRPGVNVAQCHGPHATMLRVLDDMLVAAGLPAPRHVVEPWCTCGLYSWRRPDRIGSRPDKITGVVEMWGRVLVGEHGFRAEYARVVALAGPRPGQPRGSGRVHPTDHQRAAIAARFAVPYFETLDEAITNVDDGR